MATLRQKKLAKEIVNNLNSKEVKTAAQMLVSVGYDEITASAAPGRTINQKGVKEELKKLGFDEDTAKEVVADILINGDEDRDRLKAAEMVFKVHGSFAPDKHVTLNLTPEASPRIKELAKKLNS